MEDSQNIFLWVGREAVPQLVADVFDLSNYQALRGGKVRAQSPLLHIYLQSDVFFFAGWGIGDAPVTREPILTTRECDHWQDSRI